MRVELLPRQTVFPDRCCSCGGASPSHTYRVDHGRALSWHFPICAPCRDWVRLLRRTERKERAWIAFRLLAAGLLAALGWATGFDPGRLLVGAAVLAAIGTELRAHPQRLRREVLAMRPDAGDLRPPVRYLPTRGGRHRFELRNAQFASLILSDGPAR